MARLLASHGQWRPLVLLLEEALSAVGRKGKVALVWNVAQVITCPFHFLARRPEASKPRKQAVLRHSHSLCLYKGGGRGPLRIPRPPPACPSLPSSAGIGGRGAAGQLLRRLGAPSFLHKLSVQPAQFIPLNRARIFFAGTVTALPLPYAVCSLYVNCCRLGTISEPCGPCMVRGLSLSRFSGHAYPCRNAL